MLSALALARGVEAGELTPRKLVETCAEAIADREKDIGAFATLDLAGARRAAEGSQLASLPLRGLPVAFKDIFDTVGSADAVWIAGLCRSSASGRCQRGGDDAPSRRHPDRQDGDDAIRLAGAVGDA